MLKIDARIENCGMYSTDVNKPPSNIYFFSQIIFIFEVKNTLHNLHNTKLLM